MIITNDSNRSVDEFGYMTVENCVLTGEDVAMYWGYEIPNYKSMGLDEKKAYAVYRPREEIKKSDFSNVPLLSKHADFSAEDYKYKLIVGTIGETKTINNEEKGTVVFWSKNAQTELEKGLKFLSCGYLYDPVLESGTHNGKPYQIKMTNIIANHVAMVDNPRYKRAIVADQQTTERGNMFFTKKKKLAKDEEFNFEDGMSQLYDCMTGDASPEEKEKAFGEMKEKIKEHLSDTKKLEPAAEDEKLAEPGKVKDEKEVELENKEEKKDGVEDAKKMIGDADIKKLVADAVSVEIQKYKRQSMAFDSAITQYERVCGKANKDAFKSAEQVLETILKNNKVTFDGKSFEQKEAMVEMLPTIKSFQQSHQTKIVNDNSSVKTKIIPQNVLNYLKERV